MGGHDIPEAVIRRPFLSRLVNFGRHYRPAVNDWTLYDISGAELLLIEWGESQ